MFRDVLDRTGRGRTSDIRFMCPEEITKIPVVRERTGNVIDNGDGLYKKRFWVCINLTRTVSLESNYLQ